LCGMPARLRSPHTESRRLLLTVPRLRELEASAAVVPARRARAGGAGHGELKRFSCECQAGGKDFQSVRPLFLIHADAEFRALVATQRRSAAAQEWERRIGPCLLGTQRCRAVAVCDRCNDRVRRCRQLSACLEGPRGHRRFGRLVADIPSPVARSGQPKGRAAFGPLPAKRDLPITASSTSPGVGLRVRRFAPSSFERIRQCPEFS